MRRSIYIQIKFRRQFKIVGLLIMVPFIACSETYQVPFDNKRPNILLLVADDLGYSDLGCYGGDIDTPNIDELAAKGILFSRFHTAPMCAPTRAMLLTGNDNHIAGIGRQNLRTEVFGYEGHLSNRVAALPSLLQKSGYHTYMTGKWHLGNNKKDNPHNNGFENSFVLLEGVGNHFSRQGIFKESPESHYTLDGNVTTWPEGQYSTDLYTDKLIEYINNNKDDEKPFFAYAAYTSPHWPLQVSETYWKKYEGQYDEGYEKLRDQRLHNLIEKGLIPKDTGLPLQNDRVVSWGSLTEDEKHKESRKMELYAGMVDNLDENIGRIIQYLKDIGEYENTFIVFMSDNGAAGEDYFNNPNIRPHISDYYVDDFEVMGEPNSLVSYGAPWAEASTSPFRDFKEFTSNGGILAPLIISGPMIERTNQIHHGFATVMDLAPTFIELAKTIYPKRQNGHKLYPMKGFSMLPFVKGESKNIHTPEYVFSLEHSGYTMLRKGFWKITNTQYPFSEANFELFDLSKDISERYDLKEAFPEKYRELLEEWDKFSKDTKLQLKR
jgi:arylsulfatase A-like enzyme